jgi:DnaA family protein
MTLQLPLPLTWPDQATFDNFYAEENAAACAFLQKMVQNSTHAVVYLQGISGVGLSHLLYASCHLLQQKGETAAYFSLKNAQLFPEMLEGMEQVSLLCCDDIEQIAGQRQWEEALFHCYNRVQTSGTRLLLAGHAPLATMGWGLADLQSRFMASTVFTVQPLVDAQKVRALQYRAKQRGLILSDEVGNYLLKHCPRDMHALFALLEKLDHFSLSTQRRLTIPFVREVLLDRV